MRILNFLLLFFLGCSNPTWDLSKPIYVYTDTSTPHASLYQIGAQSSIKELGGSISFNYLENQRLVIHQSSTGSCTNPIVEAYSELSGDDHHIAICESTRQGLYSQADIDDIIMHEIGHIFASRSDHLDCASKNVMAPDRKCHTHMPYSKADIDYICSTRNTIDGKCN